MRENVIWCPSPNFKPFAAKRPVTCVVIHATATAGLDSPKNWLCSPESKVSAHYLIGKDGAVYQLLDENNEAWHAGVSEWRGRQFVNLFSIGVELVNANDGKDLYPQPQHLACAKLVAAICKDNGVVVQDVVGHLDIAPGRKTDPAGFNLTGFRLVLIGMGVATKEA